MEKYNFQYCQKIVVFRNNNTEVLLAKRKGENDYDGTFSFIGGKMETTDNNPVEGMRREKNEEVVEKLDSIQDYKKILLKQKSLLKELFDSVLHKSMNGETD